MGKELWGHVDGSDPAPTDPKTLVQWKVKDARVMTWILGSIDPLLTLNLRSHKTAKSMWEYLKKVYHHDHSARRFQLETDLAAYSQALELIKSVQEHRKKISLALLEQAKEICSKHGVVAVTITEVGDPKGIICEAVEKFKIDLLILGNHGRGALQRAFLGSVSNYCMQHAKCPVLVVKKQT
ncbi:universal stress protein A-like protein isoform X1 [Magnolia sinica]|uniref:universal stress protein A-like protein isoform X1 n=1 Tax=Magnolia sinica TaxID=86752 RepID=UPI00265A48B6|nr:universal stress protein A-like protein isoform X1 [Magnolia sinica]